MRWTNVFCVVFILSAGTLVVDSYVLRQVEQEVALAELRPEVDGPAPSKAPDPVYDVLKKDLQTPGVATAFSVPTSLSRVTELFFGRKN